MNLQKNFKIYKYKIRKYIKYSKNKNMSDLLKFLEKFKVKKGELYTHLGMSNPRGAFNIPDTEKLKFYKLYNKYVFKSKNRCDLIERHKDICYILYDLDFKVNSELKFHIYTNEFIMEFLKRTSQVLKRFFDVEDDLLKAFVMEKEIQEDCPPKKDGIHIVFPYLVTFPAVQYLIREELLVEAEDIINELNIDNKVEDVIDECVIEKNGWMMYGSYKENNSPYLLTGIYDISDFNNIKKQALSAYYVKPEELIQLLSIHSSTMAELTPIDESAKRLIKSWEEQKKKNEILKKQDDLCVKSSVNLYEHDIQTVQNLVRILSSDRAESYSTWIEVGWCLHNIDFRLLDDWIFFSKRSQKHGETCELECKSWWCTMKNTGLNIGSLHMWAKMDNPQKYLEIIQNNIEFHICKSVSVKSNKFESSEMVYHMVMALKIKYGHFFKCSSYSKRTWYEFDGVRWELGDDDVGLRKKLREELYEDYMNIGMKYHSLAKVLKKLENAHPNLEKYQTTSTSLCGIARQLRDAKFRKKVTEEACEQLYWDRDQSEKFKGATFEEVLDTHTHLIGLQNGVYDLKMHQFREGRCEDYITLNTMRDWKEFEWTDPIIDEIRTFLKQVIPNDSVREYVLYTLATFLDGEIVHEHFHIWIGSGGNGKSKLIELFEHAMGKYCAKLAVSALTQKRASSSAPTPEIVRLKGKRFVVLQEPNENEKIQVGIMKEMTGGDKIVARGLNKEPIEFKPQMKMVLTCNQAPKVPADDGGTWRRIRLIKFTSVFTDTPDPENINEFPLDNSLGDKLKMWGSAFFWMLTEYYKKYKKNGFTEPEAVKLSTREYQKTNDIYADFIDLHIEKVPKSILYSDDVFDIFVIWFRHAYPDRRCPCRKDICAYMEKKFGVYISSKNKRKGWKGLKCHAVTLPPPESLENDDSDSEEEFTKVDI
jgi:P4 family phage/plasmid primase-like protien